MPRKPTQEVLPPWLHPMMDQIELAALEQAKKFIELRIEEVRNRRRSMSETPAAPVVEGPRRRGRSRKREIKGYAQPAGTTLLAAGAALNSPHSTE